MALTAAQAAQKALNIADALDAAVRNGQPLSDAQYRQNVAACLVLLAQAALGSGPASVTLTPGQANLTDVSATRNVSTRG